MIEISTSFDSVQPHTSNESDSEFNETHYYIEACLALRVWPQLLICAFISTLLCTFCDECMRHIHKDHERERKERKIGDQRIAMSDKKRNNTICIEFNIY